MFLVRGKSAPLYLKLSLAARIYCAVRMLNFSHKCQRVLIQVLRVGITNQFFFSVYYTTSFPTRFYKFIFDVLSCQPFSILLLCELETLQIVMQFFILYTTTIISF
jgi:hypothetical protein